MPRIKLTDEERFAKKKERSRFSFSEAAYKNRYDASKGFGSADEWIKAAEALVGGRLVLMHNVKTANADLTLFGLTELPDSVELLKKAYRNSLFVYHPDHGGSDAQAIAARDAFERLLKNYK